MPFLYNNFERGTKHDFLDHDNFYSIADIVFVKNIIPSYSAEKGDIKKFVHYTPGTKDSVRDDSNPMQRRDISTETQFRLIRLLRKMTTEMMLLTTML